MWCKGGLFVVLGAVLLVFLEAPPWKMAGLLALVIWVFCRAYYFAFYVIEYYIDGLPGSRRVRDGRGKQLPGHLADLVV